MEVVVYYLRHCGPLIAGLLALGAGPSPWLIRSSAQEPAPIKLDIALDDSVYATHQPISVLLSVGGADGRGVDIPSLTLEGEMVDLALVDEDRGPLSRTVSHDIIRGGIGSPRTIRVAPGKVHVEVFNLLFIYGQFIDRAQPLALSFGQFVLPPGSYALQARLRSPNGLDRDAWGLAISNEVRFRILPASSFREDSLQLATFVERAQFPERPAFLTKDGARIKSLCRDSLSSFLRSRYLMLVYYASDLPNRSLPVETMMKSMVRAGVPEKRMAAIFWEECMVALKKGHEKAVWLRSMRGSWLSGTLAAVRDTWLERVEAGLFDPASELMDH